MLGKLSERQYAGIIYAVSEDDNSFDMSGADTLQLLELAGNGVVQAHLAAGVPDRSPDHSVWPAGRDVAVRIGLVQAMRRGPVSQTSWYLGHAECKDVRDTRVDQLDLVGRCGHTI